MPTRTQLKVQGIVQGVGFRPYVFTLASRGALKGRVHNSPTGVLIDLEGESSTIERFIDEITLNPPPLSLIESVERHDNLDLAHYRDFRIVESTLSGERFTPISADISTCADCLRELFDTEDRRYRYPFINCTNCGPRFTIIEGIPYDREQTTMGDFVMCEECRAEYENPLDRRFHAEPTACPQCGPQLKLTDANGLLDCGFGNADGGLADAHVSLIRNLQSALRNGKVVVIKGIGGFHLACDALNGAAVERLRQRKYREDKPFALMAKSVEVIKEYARVSKAEETLLNSERRPVVLLEKRVDARIPEAVAPGVNTLGFLLPYTPLHHLILENLEHPLVMTSGNISDEPICYEDEEAIRRLNRIADYFLLHDRRIHIRTDDSVARINPEGREMLLRRSRGYAPLPIRTSFKFEREILACGAELKNTFCLTRGPYAFLSHHIGDLENLETLKSFKQGIEHYKRLFHLQPELTAYDLHPEYLSTKYALALDESYKIGVQHHHAHIASCMADNNVEGEVIGVAMDGLGFGTDGRMWGGEFFVADFLAAERIAHLDYIPMPGSAKAVREPWRMAASYLHRTFGDDFLKLDLPCIQNMELKTWTTLRRMIETGTNTPETSSMGRLFDAVSSLLGLRNSVNYEGQAAIELEGIADKDCIEGYEFEFTAGENIIGAETVIRRAVEDLLDGYPPQTVSARFHFGVASLIWKIARHVRDERGLNRVALSGGVFQNMLLLGNVCRMLRRDGFEVLTHSRVPANDGGISFGQAAVANAQFGAGRI
jgi:hydrogenase maturation protein HypF